MSFGRRLSYRAKWLCLVVGTLVTLLIVCWAALPAGAAGDDDIPGVPITTSPIMGYLAQGADQADVFAVAMKQGDRLTLTLNGDATSEGYFWPEVYAPDALSYITTEPVADFGTVAGYPHGGSYNAPSAGIYFVAVRAPRLIQVYGNYSLAWKCQSPTLTLLTSRSKTIRRGKSTTVAGAVKLDVDSSAVAGPSVNLQKSLTGRGGWKTVASKATDASGAFSFRVKVSKTTYYRVQSPQTASLLKSTSMKVKYRVR